jgi:hypothetical protein
MSSKSNAVDGERTKLSLDGKQKAPIMALGEENLRHTCRKAFRKAVAGFRVREDKEKDETYEKAVGALLAGELVGLVPKAVAVTEATSVRTKSARDGGWTAGQWTQ